MIAVLVLAGGAGRRFGGAKQLHEVGGRPMLERVVAIVNAAELGEVVVVLGARAGEVAAAVDLGTARAVVCERWDDGQAASLRCGLGALGDDVSAALVVLGDGPNLDPRALRRMAVANQVVPEAVLAADYGAGRSHPVVLPREVWSDLPESGEAAGRTLPWESVDCTDLTPPGDVDYAS